jgi:hypothetical protein
MKPQDQSPFFRQFVAAMLGYAAMLALTLFLLLQLGPVPWRFAVAVLPVVPVVFAVRAVAQGLSRMDELQQAVQLQALAFAFGLTALATLTYGFLELAGLPRLSWIWVMPVLCVAWAIGLVLAERKYR